MEVQLRSALGRILFSFLFVFVGMWHSTGGTLRIRECNSAGWLEVQEGIHTTATLTCDNLTSSDQVTWQLTQNDKTIRVFQCGSMNLQCNSTDADIQIHRPDAATSVLTVSRNLRSRLGNTTVACSNHFNYVDCRVNVIATGTLSLCNVKMDDTDWTVRGSCRFEKAFSSNGTYLCTWHQAMQNQSGRHESIISGSTNKEMSQMGNTTFFNGSCSFSTSLSPTDGEGDYSYAVDFFPGSKGNTFTNPIKIQKPGVPRTDCPQFVYEGERLHCSCFHNIAKPGNPRPVLQWAVSNPGPELVIPSTLRAQSGEMFRCVSKWGPASETVDLGTNYTLDVAYGPDTVTMTRVEEKDLKDPNVFTLHCTATGLYPSAILSWSDVTCNSSLFTLDTAVKSECVIMTSPMDDGKVITCTAVNSAFPDNSKNATYQLHFPLPETDKGVPVAYIAGGVGGGVLFLVAVAVIVFCVCRNRRRKPQQKPEEEMHVNPVYDPSEPMTTTTHPSSTVATMSEPPALLTTPSTATPRSSTVAFNLPPTSTDQEDCSVAQASGHQGDFDYSALSFKGKIPSPASSNPADGTYSRITKEQFQPAMVASSTGGEGISTLPVDVDLYAFIGGDPDSLQGQQELENDGYSAIGFTGARPQDTATGTKNVDEATQSLDDSGSANLKDRSSVTNDRSPELSDRSREINLRSAELSDRSPELNDRSPELNNRSPELNDRSQELNDRSPDNNDQPYSGDTYSVIKKDNPRQKPDRGSDTSLPEHADTEEDQCASENVYAQVDKSRIRSKPVSREDEDSTQLVADLFTQNSHAGGMENSTAVEVEGDQNSIPATEDMHEYAQVNKTTAKNTTETLVQRL